MNYSIHKLNKYDYKQFKNIHLQLIKTKDFDYEKYIELLNNIDKTDSLYVCVKLKDSDKLIACVKFLYDFKLGNNKGFIDDLVIDENYRNQKIGTFLVNYIIDYAKTKNCYVVYAICNNITKCFYTKLNFKIDKTITYYVIKP